MKKPSLLGRSGPIEWEAWDGSGAALQWFWLMHPEAICGV